MLPLDLKCSDCKNTSLKIPKISASASKDKEGKVHITVANIDPNNEVDLSCELRGNSYTKVGGRILTADSVSSHNSFDKPDNVKPVIFNGASLNGQMISVKMPAKSIVVLEIE